MHIDYPAHGKIDQELVDCFDLSPSVVSKSYRLTPVSAYLSLSLSLSLSLFLSLAHVCSVQYLQLFVFIVVRCAAINSQL